MLLMASTLSLVDTKNFWNALELTKSSLDSCQQNDYNTITVSYFKEKRYINIYYYYYYLLCMQCRGNIYFEAKIVAPRLHVNEFLFIFGSIISPEDNVPRYW